MVIHAIRPSYCLYRGNALRAYADWPAPDTIVSDGAYGVRGFHGDTTGVEGLVDWYRPHVTAWARAAKPRSTLWFWNTEIGWATVHPLLVEHGWEYVQTVTWDKGVSHVAGNVNGRTIRRFPVVTEVAVLYQRRLTIDTPDGPMDVKPWLRYEWQRAGIPLNQANAACGVKNAATRKYLTTDWLWYWPPGEMMARLARYANEHGLANERPFYALDGTTPVTAEEWNSLRYSWRHTHGLTNVWQRPQLNGSERFRGNLERAAPRVHNPSVQSASHLNQKPLEFMRRQVAAVTAPNDVVWEPFGGLASASVAAVELGRRAYVAEINPTFQEIALGRLMDAAAQAGRATA